MPFDVRQYHPKWPLIRRLVLRRDWFTCQCCGAPDGAVGFFVGPYFFSNSDLHEYYYHLMNQKGYTHFQASEAVAIIGPRLQKICLSVTHLDNNKENNRFDNLLSLCGRCHLLQDQEHHIYNFKYGVNHKEGQYSIFEVLNNIY